MCLIDVNGGYIRHPIIQLLAPPLAPADGNMFVGMVTAIAIGM